MIGRMLLISVPSWAVQTSLFPSPRLGIGAALGADASYILRQPAIWWVGSAQVKLIASHSINNTKLRSNPRGQEVFQDASHFGNSERSLALLVVWCRTITILVHTHTYTHTWVFV
ncbi:hypothetical protein N656DRAFT_271667 [Canariomyces notabilis]|uniref:Uncharacterized protein n=1 Tax=Canariomyces notabilis TaxID=2074819 RepID=A0AAN6TLR5_9PEZI|nr:hypothetical protein N656DRAFT_271667 [Canariomyces arenarius]